MDSGSEEFWIQDGLIRAPWVIWRLSAGEIGVDLGSI